MYQRKYLNKYKNKYKLPENDDFLHYLDGFFRYHKKHLKLRKLLKKYEDKYALNDMQKVITRTEKYHFIEKQNEINIHIKALFTLIILELFKMIDSDEIFSSELDKKILMDGYYYNRIKYKKIEKVDTISKQIKHFRDACVHKEDDNISVYTEFVERKINGGYLHLPFTVSQDLKRYFIIGEGKLPYERFEQIIKYTLEYYYK